MKKKILRMSIREALSLIEHSTEEDLEPLADALLRALPCRASKVFERFSAGWNYNHPYEYYVRELVALIRETVASYVGKDVGLLDRLMGKKVICYDSVIRVHTAPESGRAE